LVSNGQVVLEEIFICFFAEFSIVNNGGYLGYGPYVILFQAGRRQRT
jgi:hypothetical protein